MPMDLLVWTIAHAGRSAEVAEDGSLSGDPELCRLLREKLSEPVVVYRRGTVQRRGAGEEAAAIQLHPGDGRYVVARVRTLCDGDSEFEITGCDWR
jgi:hypothetical protein